MWFLIFFNMCRYVCVSYYAYKINTQLFRRQSCVHSSSGFRKYTSSGQMWASGQVEESRGTWSAKGPRNTGHFGRHAVALPFLF